MRPERITQVLRDSGSVLLGLGVISHQAFVVPPGQASEMLVMAGIALLTGPALGGAIGLRRDATTSGDGSGSPPQPSSSPSSSSSSPASSGAGEPQ